MSSCYIKQYLLFFWNFCKILFFSYLNSKWKNLQKNNKVKVDILIRNYYAVSYNAKNIFRKCYLIAKPDDGCRGVSPTTFLG